jgi:ribosomal protein S18 acetylase RimI-like enzyme
MDSVEIEISDRPAAADTTFLYRQLDGYNEACAGPTTIRPLAVFARRDGAVVAGLFAYTLWDWLEIRHLWVAEGLRRRGLGRRLMVAAEREARLRGCDHAHVDTFTFQAVPFYERLGYSVFGRLEGYPAGHARVFLVKRHLSGGGDV